MLGFWKTIFFQVANQQFSSTIYVKSIYIGLPLYLEAQLDYIYWVDTKNSVYDIGTILLCNQWASRSKTIWSRVIP